MVSRLKLQHEWIIRWCYYNRVYHFPHVVTNFKGGFLDSWISKFGIQDQESNFEGIGTHDDARGSLQNFVENETIHVHERTSGQAKLKKRKTFL